MSELERIKERVRKLLALSKSDNENEAALALEKANELIETYSLEEGDLKYESRAVKPVTSYWRIRLAGAVAWLYGCHYYRNGIKILFTGYPLDVFMSAEMYAYLARTVERIAKKAIRKNAKTKFRQSFKAGMAARLAARIHELGSSCAWAGIREQRIDEVSAYVKETIPLDEKEFKKTKHNALAYHRGITYANDIALARQTGHTPSPMIAARAATVQGELF
jgi:hypothetical protein